MVLKNIHSVQSLVRLLLLMGCCIPLTALAADPYMDALNAEADSVAVDPASEKQETNVLDQAPTLGGWSNQDQSMSLDLPANLEREDFEESLKLNFYGSYMFYNRLDEINQAKVYEFYQSNPTIEPVRERIMELKKSR